MLNNFEQNAIKNLFDNLPAATKSSPVKAANKIVSGLNTNPDVSFRYDLQSLVTTLCAEYAPRIKEDEGF